MLPGTLVSLTDEYQDLLRRECRHNMKDVEGIVDCYKCSTYHLLEIGDGIGFVEGYTDDNLPHKPFDPQKIGPDVLVRWREGVSGRYDPTDLCIISHQSA